MGKALYLGLDSSNWQGEHEIKHVPIIETTPIAYDSKLILSMLQNLNEITHFIFTSKTTVRYFLETLDFHNLSSSIFKAKHVIAIGEATQGVLKEQGVDSSIPKVATQEGIIAYLEALDLEKSYVCIPRSSLARGVLDTYLQKRQISFFAFSLYETRMRSIAENINLDNFDEIIFTSPSTVDAFFAQFKSISKKNSLRCIGPITKKHLEKKQLQLGFC